MGLPLSEAFNAANKGLFDGEFAGADALIEYPSPGYGGSGFCCHVGSYGASNNQAWLTEAIAALGSGQYLDAAFYLKHGQDGDIAAWSPLFKAENATNNAGVYIEVYKTATSSQYKLRIGNGTTYTETGYYTLSSWVAARLYVNFAAAGKLRLEIGGALAAQNLSINTLPNGNIDRLRPCVPLGSNSVNIDTYFDTFAISATAYPGWAARPRPLVGGGLAGGVVGLMA